MGLALMGGWVASAGAVQAPLLTLPTITLPTVTLPTVTLPTVTLPTVTTPTVTVPPVPPPPPLPPAPPAPITVPGVTLPSAHPAAAAWKRWGRRVERRRRKPGRRWISRNRLGCLGPERRRDERRPAGRDWHEWRQPPPPGARLDLPHRAPPPHEARIHPSKAGTRRVRRPRAGARLPPRRTFPGPGPPGSKPCSDPCPGRRRTTGAGDVHGRGASDSERSNGRTRAARRRRSREPRPDPSGPKRQLVWGSLECGDF